MLRHLPLSLREAWTFSISPTDPDDVPVASALLTLATAYAFCRRVTPAALLHAPLAEARSEMALQQVCCGEEGRGWGVVSGSCSHSGGKAAAPMACQSPQCQLLCLPLNWVPACPAAGGRPAHL